MINWKLLILAVLVISLLDISSMYFIQSYTKSHLFSFIILSTFLFFIMSFVLSYAFSQESVSFIFLLWTTISILILFLFGILYHKTKIQIGDIIVSFLIVIISFILYYTHKDDPETKGLKW